MGSVVLLTAFLVALLQPRLPNPLLVEPTMAWLLVCCAFAAIVLLRHWARGGGWRTSPFDYVLCGYLAVVLLTWPTSVDRHETGLAVARLLGQIAVFCAVRVLADERPGLHRLVVVAFVIGFAMFGWIATEFHIRAGLESRMIDYPRLEWNGRQGLGTIGAIQFALLVGVWQHARSGVVQISALLVIVVGVAELVFSYSRDPWVASCVVLLVASITAFRRGGFGRFLVAAGVILASVLIIRTPYVDRLVRLAAGMEIGQEGGIVLRLVAWRDAIVVIRQHALAGVGLGNFIPVRQINGSIGSPMILPTQELPVHPHNLYLQQIAEVGIFGGLTYIAMWTTALWAGWRISMWSGNRAGVRMSLFYALVAIVTMNLGENMFLDAVAAERVRFHTIAWMLLALIIAEWNRVRGAAPSSGYAVAA